MRYVVTRKPRTAVKTRDIFSEMDRMMNSYYQDKPDWESKTPRVDILEKEDRYLMEVELPGYTEGEVHLRVEENLLVLETHRDGDEKNEEERFLVKERSGSGYKRSFVLPKDVDAGEISAAMRNGVLSLELQKSEASKPRTIEIKVD